MSAPAASSVLAKAGRTASVCPSPCRNWASVPSPSMCSCPLMGMEPAGIGRDHHRPRRVGLYYGQHAHDGRRHDHRQGQESPGAPGPDKPAGSGHGRPVLRGWRGGGRVRREKFFGKFLPSPLYKDQGSAYNRCNNEDVVDRFCPHVFFFYSFFRSAGCAASRGERIRRRKS